MFLTSVFLARLGKLNLYDDNSSFFSRNTFNPFSKLDGTSDHSQAMSNAQLPDLLNGAVNNNNSMGLDPKQLLKNLSAFGSNETQDDWENAFKLIITKNSFTKHYEEQQQHQHEDWLRFQEMKRHPNVSGSGGLGLNQFNNMFNSKYVKAVVCHSSANLFLSGKEKNLILCLRFINLRLTFLLPRPLLPHYYRLIIRQNCRR
jgi:hypothetical protein